MTKLRTLLLITPLVLAGCGEGYEMVRTDSFPYNNERTAGTGVAYVLAKIAPARELNLKPVERKQEPAALKETKQILDKIEEPVLTPKPAVDMDEVFEEAQTK